MQVPEKKIGIWKFATKHGLNLLSTYQSPHSSVQLAIIGLGVVILHDFNPNSSEHQICAIPASTGIVPTSLGN